MGLWVYELGAWSAGGACGLTGEICRQHVPNACQWALLTESVTQQGPLLFKVF